MEPHRNDATAMGTEQPLGRVALCLGMILLPQSALLITWAAGRLDLEPGVLLGVTHLLRDLAADAQGIRRALWLLGTCGLVGIAISLLPQSQRSARALRGLCFAGLALLCVVSLAAAHATGARLAWLGSLIGMLVLAGLLYAGTRMFPAFAASRQRQRPTATTTAIYGAAAALALWLYWPAITSLDTPGYDETFSLLHYAALGPLVSLGRYDFPNNHIAFNVIVGTLFPGGTPSLLIARLAAFGCFLGLLAAAGSIAYRLGGRTAQLVTLSCLLLHATLFQQASTGRGYTMAMFLATLGWRCLLAPAQSRGRGYAPICFLGATAAVPSWIVLLGIGAMAEWLGSRTWTTLRPWLACAAGALLWYLPAGVFLGFFWDDAWLGNQRTTLAPMQNALPIMVRYVVGWPADTLSGWAWLLSAIAVCFAVGAYAAGVTGGWFVRLALLGFVGATMLCLDYAIAPVVRQLGIFIPLYAVLVGTGIARMTRRFGARFRAFIPAGAGGLLLALPVLSGAVKLGPLEPSPSLAQTADLLRERVGREDLVHASSPDSATVVYLMGAGYFFHALDVILARKAWRLAEGDIWMVVRPARSTLQRQLARLRGYTPDNERFLPPQLVFRGGEHLVYRLAPSAQGRSAETAAPPRSLLADQ